MHPTEADLSPDERRREIASITRRGLIQLGLRGSTLGIPTALAITAPPASQIVLATMRRPRLKRRTASNRINAVSAMTPRHCWPPHGTPTRASRIEERTPRRAAQRLQGRIAPVVEHLPATTSQ